MSLCSRCYINKIAQAAISLIMQRRRILIILLLVAFLFSAWSNVIAAAFCPSYLSRNCYLKKETRSTKRVDSTSCHLEMPDMYIGDMKMGEEQVDELTDEMPSKLAPEPTVLTGDSVIARTELESSNEPCGHCSRHNQPPAGSVTLTAINLSPQWAGIEGLTANFEIGLPAAVALPITPLEHGPPGNSFPRHILINVFRI